MADEESIQRQGVWEAATIWPGDLPPPGVIWEMLTSASLPKPFRDAVREKAGKSELMRAGLAQTLAARGIPDRLGGGRPSANEIAEAMRQMVGYRPQTATAERLLAEQSMRSSYKIAFTNLVSGRFTELVFERAFAPLLADAGLELLVDVADRSFLDYRIQTPDGLDLGVNLKNAGVQYRDAAKWVRLEPEDTLPIATYKIFGSEEAGIPHLMYVYLVDWSLLERLRTAFLKEVLSDEERDIFRLLASVTGIPRDIEDAFIDGTVRDRLDVLIRAVGYERDDLTDLPFRAISAGKCRRIFYDNRDRSPYVYKQKMNTDPNVHVSIAQDTLPFVDFFETYLATPQGRENLMVELTRTASVTISSPAV